MKTRKIDIHSEFSNSLSKLRKSDKSDFSSFFEDSQVAKHISQIKLSCSHFYARELFLGLSPNLAELFLFSLSSLIVDNSDPESSNSYSRLELMTGILLGKYSILCDKFEDLHLLRVCENDELEQEELLEKFKEDCLSSFSNEYYASSDDGELYEIVARYSNNYSQLPLGLVVGLTTDSNFRRVKSVLRKTKFFFSNEIAANLNKFSKINETSKKQDQSNPSFSLRMDVSISGSKKLIIEKYLLSGVSTLNLNLSSSLLVSLDEQSSVTASQLSKIRSNCTEDYISALITENSSILSHLSIVSREFDIPVLFVSKVNFELLFDIVNSQKSVDSSDKLSILSFEKLMTSSSNAAELLI